uniref:Uncharacterized protein n=1 Tax=Knipowitschia caucasica TaxID=637954 RepID=A0AAV2LDN2_KNICA
MPSTATAAETLPQIGLRPLGCGQMDRPLSPSAPVLSIIPGPVMKQSAVEVSAGPLLTSSQLVPQQSVNTMEPSDRTIRPSLIHHRRSIRRSSHPTSGARMSKVARWSPWVFVLQRHLPACAPAPSRGGGVAKPSSPAACGVLMIMASCGSPDQHRLFRA